MVVSVVFLGVFRLFRSSSQWNYVSFFQVFIVVFCGVKIEQFLVWKGDSRYLVGIGIYFGKPKKKETFIYNSS